MAFLDDKLGGTLWTPHATHRFYTPCTIGLSNLVWIGSALILVSNPVMKTLHYVIINLVSFNMHTHCNVKAPQVESNFSMINKLLHSQMS